MVCICIDRKRTGVSLALMVKNLAAIQETWIQSLGQEDPLEEKMKKYSCPRNLLDREAWRAIGYGSQRIEHN